MTLAAARRVAPGVLLAAAVAAASVAAAPVLGALPRAVWGSQAPVVPAMVLALVLGIALGRIAARPAFAEGLGFCAKRVLRVAVALLGLRIAVGDVLALGAGTALLVAAAMAGTLVLAVWMGRRLGQEAGAGALAGAATAVCGASATLA
ncbi:MAG: putative sulfate exporter family transporter, partial [Acetobacteraceae bacterium]|nr:putative sulfate exporter family transporter [Acetobacteraceae bacterium]